MACNKREAFVQGSKATKQSIGVKGPLDCFASLAMMSLVSCEIGIASLESPLFLRRKQGRQNFTGEIERCHAAE
jgi:hypothetical protein